MIGCDWAVLARPYEYTTGLAENFQAQAFRNGTQACETGRYDGSFLRKGSSAVFWRRQVLNAAPKTKSRLLRITTSWSTTYDANFNTVRTPVSHGVPQIDAKPTPFVSTDDGARTDDRYTRDFR